MKKKNLFVLLVLIGSIAFICNISACSKSSKDGNNDSNHSISNGNESNNNDGNSNTRKNDNGISITFTNIPQVDDYWYELTIYEKVNNEGKRTFVAYGSAQADNNEVAVFELFKIDPQQWNPRTYKPWSAPGEYYLLIDSNYFYTNGKLLKELGKTRFENTLTTAEEWKLLPAFSIKEKDNTIDFEKQMVKISINTDRS